MFPVNHNSARTMTHRRSFLLALAGAALALTAPVLAWPPIFLGFGNRAPISGTRSSQLPELAGTVVHDRVTGFTIRNGAGALLFSGRLQDRVVRSTATGNLHFYYRIRNTDPAPIGDVMWVVAGDFSGTPNCRVDWRPDGLGSVAPTWAVRSVDGANIGFMFSPDVIDGGEESRFCFVMTDKADYQAGGTVRIQLFTGEFTDLPVMMPLP